MKLQTPSFIQRSSSLPSSSSSAAGARSPRTQELSQTTETKLGSRRWAIFAALTLVVVGSLNEYQIFYQLHRASAQEFIDIAHGVLLGHPPWRAFQARLFGPLTFAAFESCMHWLQAGSPTLYRMIERVFRDPDDTRSLAVFNAFGACLILTTNLVAFALLLRYSKSLIKAIGGTLFASLLFVMLSDHWIYSWDFFEQLFFFVFAYSMFTNRKADTGFFLLYALTLANRESAAFFGVWLLCSVFSNKLIHDRMLWLRTMLGVGLVGIAIFYVVALRNALFIESTLGHETGYSLGATALALGDGVRLHQAFGNHLMLFGNVIQFFKNLVTSRFYVDVYVALIAWHGLFLARLGLKWRSSQIMAIGMFNTILLVSILNFGVLNETRMYLICIPMLVFSVVTFAPQWLSFLMRIDQ